MRQIGVSVDVFAAIWSLREAGEDSENAILSRVLTKIETRDNVSQYERPEESQPTRQDSSASANREKGSRMNPTRQEFNGVSSDSAWWQVVEAALRRLGGEAELFYIYREVDELCNKIGKRVPQTLDATIRGTLEDNCSESGRYKRQRDVFFMPHGKGKGIWALKR